MSTRKLFQEIDFDSFKRVGVTHGTPVDSDFATY